ncbi:MAG: type II toxin-antitoxin system HicB family antitoxin [Desulfobacteraceae bacterium]|jgi:predicted RNase H-like HicB family nuclease
MEKFYYAVIQKSETSPFYTVEIPDIEGYTQGVSMEEAIEMAEDVVAAILEVSDNKNTKASDFETINKKYGGEGIHIMKIAVRPDLMYEWSDKVKKNISFSSRTLDEIDSFAKKMKMNRSAFIDYAAHEVINKYKSKQVSA